MEGVGYQALGEAAVGEGEGGEHDLAWGVVEVGVGDERAEAEDLAGAVFGGGEAGILERGVGVSKCSRGRVRRRWTCLNVAESGELHDGAAKGAERVLNVEREPEPLAQQELASDDVFRIVSTESLCKPGKQRSAMRCECLHRETKGDQLGDADKGPLGLARKE